MTDIFEIFLRENSYKFRKGYPDLNNEEDIFLLEKLLSETIQEPIELYEVNLNPAQLLKPFHKNSEHFGKYKDRGERFLEKIIKGEPLELSNGESVVIDKNKSKEGILLLKNKKYTSFGGTKKYFFDKEGKAYSLSNFSKTEEFGSGSGTGGGSAQTDLQESTQCLFNALSYKLKKGKLTAKDLTKENFLKVKPFIATTSPFEDLMMFALKDKSWTESMIVTANLLYSNFPISSFTFHRGSPFVEKIMDAFTIARKKEGLTLNKDKWNPSDVWLVDKSALNIEFKTELQELNNQILELYNNKKVIGVSLKKIGKDASLTVYNSQPSENSYTYEGYKSSNKSKHADVLYNDGRITLRSFNFADNFAGEIMGKTAAHGKIGTSILYNFIKKQGKVLPPTKEVRKQVYDNDEEFFDSLYYLYDRYVENVSEEDFREQFDNQNEDWKFSKYLSLAIVDVFETLPKKKRNILMNDIISYAKSSSSLSSTFVKVS